MSDVDEHAGHDQTDEGNRERVKETIELAVFDFWEQHVALGDEFHLEDLVEHVREWEPSIAPASPGRIWQLMRQKGFINYKVICRRDSLYQALPLEKKP